MTYCVAAKTQYGLVFVSDSRTNAGPDQIRTYPKMHRFGGDGERSFVLLAAGNLATTQAVVTQLNADLTLNQTSPKSESLGSLGSFAEVVAYVGKVSITEQRKHRGEPEEGSFSPEATFILGGQIKGEEPQLYMIYPQGNSVHTSRLSPYMQIGEIKYGKPIVDRIIREDTDLETAARCCLVSMDSTLRSNATVGPPIELLVYNADALDEGERFTFGEDSEYLREVRHAWDANVRAAFEKLPRLNLSAPRLRSVDGQR